jgi:predicted O-methyltransferase YrrM
MNNRSSYKNNDINYGDILETILHLNNPKSIIEIGILDGFSLDVFAKNTNLNTKIEAYDIFDEFNGNSASKDDLANKFKQYNNISIKYGDFYELYKTIDKVDIIHIDIANNGDVYNFAVKNYLPKLNDNGIIILEGGSIERDNVEWMIKYNKRKINPVTLKYNMKVIGTLPSVSILKNHI